MQHRSNTTQTPGNVVLEPVGGLYPMTANFWPLSAAAGIMRFWVKRAQAYAEQFEKLAIRRDPHAWSPDGMSHALLATSEESETRPRLIEPMRRTLPEVLAAPAARPKRATAKRKTATAKQKAVGARRKAAPATRKAVGAKPAPKARRG